MLNNRGFGIKDVMMTICIMAVAVLTTMIVYNRNFKSLFEGDKDKNSISTIEYNYVKAEESLENAAKDYYANKFDEDEDVPLMTVSYSFLKGQGYIEDLNVNGENCTGYVIVQKENSKTNYDSYIRCKNYITEGYSASLNN